MDCVTVSVIIIISTIAVIESINIFAKLPSRSGSFGFTAIIVMNGEDDIEMRMESIIHKIMWTNDELISKIIIVNNGLNDIQTELCRKYCRENNFLVMANANEIKNIIISSEKNNVK